MKRTLSIILLVLTLASCVLCLSSCRQREGSLEDINALLMQDSELNELFSSIDVEVGRGKRFNATLYFKDIESQDVKEMSVDEGCAVSKMVHDKIKEAVLDAGYKKIVWIEAWIYPSNLQDDIDNNYFLKFNIGPDNDTHVKVTTFSSYAKPWWEEIVSWGGFDEVE